MRGWVGEVWVGRLERGEDGWVRCGCECERGEGVGGRVREV